MNAALSPAQHAAIVVLGTFAYLGLALCVAIAIGMTIRDADRRAQAAAELEPVDELPPPVTGLDVLL